MSDLNDLQERVKALTRDVNRNAAAIAVKPDNAEMRAGFNEVVQWLGTLTTKQDQTQGDVSTLKADVSGLKADVSTLKTDVADIKTRLSSLEQGIQQILSLLQQR